VPDELRIDGLTIPLGEIEMRTSRSSGPGGQHANVTASRVEAVFDVEASGSLDEAQRTRLLERAGRTVAAVAQDARSQARNRELALERLAEKLAAALATPRRRRPDQANPGLPPAPPRAEAPRRGAKAREAQADGG
jgi:ribosome-associated protein